MAPMAHPIKEAPETQIYFINHRSGVRLGSVLMVHLDGGVADTRRFMRLRRSCRIDEIPDHLRHLSNWSIASIKETKWINELSSRILFPPSERGPSAPVPELGWGLI